MEFTYYTCPAIDERKWSSVELLKKHAVAETLRWVSEEPYAPIESLSNNFTKLELPTDVVNWIGDIQGRHPYNHQLVREGVYMGWLITFGLPTVEVSDQRIIIKKPAFAVYSIDSTIEVSPEVKIEGQPYKAAVKKHDTRETPPMRIYTTPELDKFTLDADNHNYKPAFVRYSYPIVKVTIHID
jgi:hypothetical protein